MALFKVTVNGKNEIVDAPSKATAGAYAAKQATFTVEPAGAGDLKDVDASTIKTILARGKVKGEEEQAPAESGAPADETAVA